MDNFLKSISFSGLGLPKNINRKIFFSIPEKIKPNCITVICGKNRTGKSYILNNIEKCVKKHNSNISHAKEINYKIINNDDITLEILDYTKEIAELYLVNNILHLTNIATTLSILKHNKFKSRGHPNVKGNQNELPFKLGLDNFARDSIKFVCLSLNKSFDDQLWDNDDEQNNYRKSLAKYFDKNILYELNRKDDLVDFFYKATGGYLYITHNKRNEGCAFDVYLVYTENMTYSFSNWSEGQKILFVCLIIIKYLKPKIFLFDEIENHLHPEFISILLEYLKESVPQSIITTHHPHIIFSKYVDKVWYLELDIENIELPSTIMRTDPKIIKAPIRKAKELGENYEKLISTYKLFDDYDNQLIRLSSSVLDDLNETVTRVFTNLFYYEIVSSNPKKKSDLQIDGLQKFLCNKLSMLSHMNILEIGAGKGRVILDISKLNNNTLSRRISWYLFEPFDEVRIQLEINIKSLKNLYDVNILNKLDESKKYDMILFANVLHELTPNVIADYLSKICSLLSQEGELIIIELYPLLQPEKYSIPFKPNELLQLFRNLGWKGTLHQINFKHSNFEAYWLNLTMTDKILLDRKLLLRSIEKFLKNKVIKNRCEDYNGRISLRDPEEIIGIMCELTTIASISSYFCKEWELKSHI